MATFPDAAQLEEMAARFNRAARVLAQAAEETARQIRAFVEAPVVQAMIVQSACARLDIPTSDVRGLVLFDRKRGPHLWLWNHRRVPL